MNSLQITLLLIIVFVFGYYASGSSENNTGISPCGLAGCSDPYLNNSVTRTAVPQLPAIDTNPLSTFETASFGLG